MTREEEIKCASKDYVNNLLDKQEYHNENYTEYDIQQAFEKGAMFVYNNPDLSSLWHDASDEPSEENVYIIAIDENGIPDTFKVQEGRKYYFHSWFIDWKELVDKLNYKTWAYCNDLLQKTVKK